MIHILLKCQILFIVNCVLYISGYAQSENQFPKDNSYDSLSLIAIDKCQEKLPSNVICTKTFKGKNTTARKREEFTVWLSKGQSYWFVISNPSGYSGGLTMTLYDSKREKLVTTNYNKTEVPSHFICQNHHSGFYFLNIGYSSGNSGSYYAPFGVIVGVDYTQSYKLGN